jgi:dynein light intermediate chain 1, cytosolic
MSENSELWTSMLQTAGRGAAIPKASLLILGDNEVQNCLIQRLTRSETRSDIANAFGLGYTYIEYKDEHEDKLSQLDIYTLDSISEKIFDSQLNYLSLVLEKTVARSERILATIALDWEGGDVSKWARTIRLWIDLLQAAIKGIDTSTAETSRLQHLFSSYIPPNAKESDQRTVEVPLEPGQFDLPLGIDLAVVMVGSEITLNSEISEDTIDYIQQVLRVITLKHGGSFINMPFSQEAPFDGLLDVISERLSLPVVSAVPQRANPSIVEQNKIVIPAGWDTTGKIEAVHEGFPVTETGTQWANDSESLINAYEATVGPEFDSKSPSPSTQSAKSAVPKTNFQNFLGEQYEMLQEKGEDGARHGHVNNVSGIQVEGMEEVLRRLKSRDAATAQQPSTPDRRGDRSESNTPQSATAQNEVLANFFQNLLTRQKQSPASSPDRRE